MGAAKWRHGWIPENEAARMEKIEKKRQRVRGVIKGSHVPSDVQFPVIHKSDLSTPDGRRSRLVSPAEFQATARRGAAKYNTLAKNRSPHTLEGKGLNDLIDRSYTEALKSWGGTTTDSHTLKDVPADADAYAVTARFPGMPEISIPEGSSKADFSVAMHKAVNHYGAVLSNNGHALGVFHDDDKGTIDIDPVAIVDTKSDAEDIGAFTGAVGGAYHFKSGDGYWPPHVADPPSSSAVRVNLKTG